MNRIIIITVSVLNLYALKAHSISVEFSKFTITESTSQIARDEYEKAPIETLTLDEFYKLQTHFIKSIQWGSENLSNIYIYNDLEAAFGNSWLDRDKPYPILQSLKSKALDQLTSIYLKIINIDLNPFADIDIKLLRYSVGHPEFIKRIKKDLQWRTASNSLLIDALHKYRSETITAAELVPTIHSTVRLIYFRVHTKELLPELIKTLQHSKTAQRIFWEAISYQQGWHYLGDARPWLKSLNRNELKYVTSITQNGETIHHRYPARTSTTLDKAEESVSLSWLKEQAQEVLSEVASNTLIMGKKEMYIPVPKTRLLRSLHQVIRKPLKLFFLNEKLACRNYFKN